MSHFAALDLYPWWTLAVAGTLGLLTGTLLTSVIVRLPVMMAQTWEQDIAEYRNEAPPPHERFNLFRPAPHCPQCKHRLRWRDQAPVLSWAALRRRCRDCGARISTMYPVVEGVTALLFMACVLVYGWQAYTVLAWVFCAFCVALAAIDWRTQLLPDTLTLGLLWLGLLVNVWADRVALADAVLGAAAGYAVLWSVYWVYRLLTGKEGMGHGDFKLFAALGAWFGWQALPWMMTMAAVAGVFVGGGLMLKKGKRLDEVLPFGPYLAASGCVQLLFGLQGGL